MSNPTAAVAPLCKGMRKIVVVAFATAVQIFKCQTFQGLSALPVLRPYRAVQATGLAGVMTYYLS